MKPHKELKKKILDYELVSTIDHIIACDETGWTDLRFTRLDQKITPESKYLLTLSENHSSYIFCYNNLMELRQEIDKWFIKKPFFKGYDKINNRVHVHYEGEGVFRFGNKKGSDAFRKEFQLCSLKELAVRNNYSSYISLLSKKEKHHAIQTLLAELGISLGYYVKLAKNDSSRILKNNPSLLQRNVLLNIPDMNLINISSKRLLDSINMIDVIWLTKNNNQIIAAFEVELSRNYASLLERMSSLLYTNCQNINFVIVGEDYINFKNSFHHPIWKRVYHDKSLGYLSLDSLGRFLNDKIKYNSTINNSTLHNMFFKNTLMNT